MASGHAAGTVERSRQIEGEQSDRKQSAGELPHKCALHYAYPYCNFTLITPKCQEHMFVYVNYILTQQCPAKDGGARRYVP